MIVGTVLGTALRGINLGNLPTGLMPAEDRRRLEHRRFMVSRCRPSGVRVESVA
jgi:hypothetical protein